MTLRRWEPFREMDMVRRQMDQLLYDLALQNRADSDISQEGQTGWYPAVELEDIGSELLLRAEVPGVDGKDLDIQVTRDAVLIAGEHRYKKRSEDKRHFRSEFHYGSFHRLVPLPAKVRNHQVRADLNNGILTLTLPKMVEEEQKRVFKVNLGHPNRTVGVGKHKCGVGVFSNRQNAEDVLRELRDSGFPMDRVSVITRDLSEDDEIAGTDVRDRAVVGAIAGGALGSISGLLVGLGILAIPGIGPIMLAGATATTIATTIAGTGIGVVGGGLIGVLIGVGIPEEQARVYNERFVRGEYLVILDGTDEEIARAEAILNSGGIEEFGVYDVSDVVTVPTSYTTNTTPSSEITGSGFARRKHAVGFFPQRRDAEQALNELFNTGFPRSQVSLIAKNFDRHDEITGVNIRDRLDATRFGFSQERTNFFNNRLSRGDYQVIVTGTEDEIRLAEAILSRWSIQDFGIYDAPDFDRFGINDDRVDRHGTSGVDTTRTAPTSVVSHHPDVIIINHRHEAL